MRNSFDSHRPRTLSVAAAASVLAGMSIIGCADAQDTGEVEGHRYVMHALKPPAESFGADPSTFDRIVVRNVEQGPEFTLMWGEGVSERSIERASFARGEHRMGLFLPNWDFDRPASDETGWSSYGHPLAFDVFEVEVTRGDDDRTIMGRTASHYVLEAHVASTRAEYVTEDMSSWPHKQVSSDLWILEDEPFGFALFSVDRAYAGPRLSAAITEELEPLGMVVRAETVYSMWGEDEDGNRVGDPLDGTHLAWVTDLEPAMVADLDIPMGTGDQLDTLRNASRENPEQTCQTVMAGQTPGFVTEVLDEEAARVFTAHLAERCEER